MERESAGRLMVRASQGKGRWAAGERCDVDGDLVGPHDSVAIRISTTPAPLSAFLLV